MAMVRPPAAVLHRAAGGQARQAAPNLAWPAGRSRPLARTGTVIPAGQVTVLASSPEANRSLGNWPLTADGGWHLRPL